MVTKKQTTSAAKPAAKTAAKAVKVAVAPVATPKGEAIRKKFTGVVVSDKMAKTIVVKVEAVKIHTKYHKRYVISRRYKVHDEKETYKVGDTVTFIGCRPFSKDKKWRVVNQ